MAHSHPVHLALGALLTPCTVCGTGLMIFGRFNVAFDNTVNLEDLHAKLISISVWSHPLTEDEVWAAGPPRAPRSV